MASTQATVAGEAQSRGGRQWLPAVAVVALLAALYVDVVAEMVHAWLNEMGASHGILIPPLVAYIVWIRRDAVMGVAAAPDLRGVWLLGLSCCVYLVGRLGAEFFLTRASLILVMASLIWTFWGRARLRELLFPLILLSTMIPIPQLIYKSIAGPLQLLASSIATNLAQALGISVFRDGNIIHLAGVSLGVEEACSGLHSISALMVGSLLVGFLYLSGKWRRTALFLSAFPIAIGANVLRVTGTAILADYRTEFAVGFYHWFSGWLVFLVAFGLLMAASAALRRTEGRSA